MTMTLGDVHEATGRPRPCTGSVSTLFIPEGRTIEDVLAEIVAMGHLADLPAEATGEWAVVECRGGDHCVCQHVEISPDFTWHHADVLICRYDADHDRLVFPDRDSS